MPVPSLKGKEVDYSDIALPSQDQSNLATLPSPPPWPTSRSEFPTRERTHKILFDASVDKDRDGRFRQLIEKIQQLDPNSEHRIKGKGKGKELLYRYEGEVVEGTRRLQSLRPGRGEFHIIKYEHDQHSVGPPPPTAVLAVNISPLTSNQQIRRHFAVHGRILSFEPEIDKTTGSALGIVYIKFSTHDEAKICVEKEHGGKSNGQGSTLSIQTIPGEELKVVLDDDAKSKLRAILRELDDRRRKGKEAALIKKKEAEAGEPFFPQHAIHYLLILGLLLQLSQNQASPACSVTDKESAFHHKWPIKPLLTESALPSSVLPIPFPLIFKIEITIEVPLTDLPQTWQSQREVVDAELERNGNEYVTIEESGGGQLGSHVKEEDVRRFFDGFKVDKVLRDHLGWCVTFQTSDSARKAKTVLNAGTRTLAHTSVMLSVHTPPSSWTPSMRAAAPSARETSRRWRDGDIAEEAERLILKELRTLLERDVMDRVIGVKLRQMVTDEKERKARGVKVDFLEGDAASEEKEKRGLKGLSFKKNRVVKPQPPPTVEEHSVTEVSPSREADEDQVDELEAVQRPKKRQRVVTEDVTEPELEVSPAVEEVEEDDSALSLQDNIAKRKEPPLADSEDVRPIKKSKATDKKKAESKPTAVEEQSPTPDVVIPGDIDFEVPVITEVRLSPERDSSAFATPEPTSSWSDPIRDGLFEDDEDMYFAKLALSRTSDGEFIVPLPRVSAEEESDPDAPPPFRVHSTGSARTEGYYKITHAEKTAYVTQYTAQAKAANKDVIPEPAVVAPTPTVTSSRSNRANARRRAQGIEEINQMQRAMQLSLGETPATDQVKFNQLQTRKKHLRFARSPIHDWGLYAMERIARGEMVIEYVGEVIRAAVADKREKAYERQGIGSSYLFRIDEDLVVDATKKGNLGRLINHSCDPNCTAKIITISGVKKIVIYAKQEIELGDEITYDYHFPIEQDKIPCLCGSAKCRGYLN
ncbi:hypothetical protein BJ322DRAFT_1222229 [Thelephora terrestris]|uniref:Histone-lysine N-methyltransferase, H3 lysine-4 specific n=1 Tax=Thelephora terrestris TaxID=56493 RepID=A0A9P6H2J6_9AGAM|nr:hypothetical protein BJ322DRAFT_1222229 [Thelephora terrestris]